MMRDVLLNFLFNEKKRKYRKMSLLDMLNTGSKRKYLNDMTVRNIVTFD